MNLSIVIPARNEMWLSRTIEDIVSHIEDETEVIAVLDGQWAEPPITVHPRVKVLFFPESIGQRAATNAGVKLSTAKYIMKCDAHCAFDQGFDRKMLEAFKETGDNVTMVPAMRNLHVFDWVCPDGHRRYQSPSGVCKECGKETTRDVVWIPKTNPTSTSYRFDTTLHFQYHSERKKTKEYLDGAIIGYKISFDQRSVSPSVISLLANLAGSHKFSGISYRFRVGKDVPVDTMSLPPVNDSGRIGVSEIDVVGNKAEMGGIATTPILTDVVNNRNALSSTSRDRSNQPSISDPMSECFFSDMSAPTITTFVDSSAPIPTTRKIINSNVVDKLNSILGGEFVYSEKTNSFHNGSVTLEVICDKSLNETMSLQGSCFMLTREKYWELGICDEDFGSWGQQGTEVACKTWLSGGRVLCNKNTWYAHLFRTQGGDFSFPYEQDNKQVEHARKYSRNLFREGKWEKAIHPLHWLIERFAPVPDWTEEEIAKLKGDPTKGILYYTDNCLNMSLARKVRKQIEKANIPITSVSLKPMNFGRNIHYKGERGYLTMFKQILAGLEAMTQNIVYFCEHDVFYHPSHFEFTPENKNTFYYNGNYWFVRQDGFAIHYDVSPLSGLVVYREAAIKHFKERVAMIEKLGNDYKPLHMGFEPFTHNRVKWEYKCPFEVFMSKEPNIDITHGANSTWKRWKQKDFIRKPKFWEEGNVKDLWISQSS